MLRWQQLHMHLIDPASASPFFKPTSENCAPEREDGALMHEVWRKLDSSQAPLLRWKKAYGGLLPSGCTS